MSDKEITFKLAPAAVVKEDRERTQTVDVLTDMKQRCSRCQTEVIGEPLGLTMQNVVDSKGMSDARRAVAAAMYGAWYVSENTATSELIGAELFDDLAYERQNVWLQASGADGWSLQTFMLENIGVGLSETVRKAGIEEAKRWPAFTDRRKVFRVHSAQFPAGWITVAFNAHSGKTGEPVEHAHVLVHICPKCAPVIFDAACVDPTDPFKDGVKW
jgi:hypothetical protein